MATLTVSYPLTPGSTFDKEYYLSRHVPLAQDRWAAFGLQSVEVLFPAEGPQPLAAMSIMRFAEQSGIDAALSSPRSLEVVNDVANFTTVQPVIFRAAD